MNFEFQLNFQLLLKLYIHTYILIYILHSSCSYFNYILNYKVIYIYIHNSKYNFERIRYFCKQYLIIRCYIDLRIWLKFYFIL